MAISQAIRRAARRDRMGVEQWRQAKGLPNTGFYLLLKDVLPAKVSTRQEWFDRLKQAGVRVPKQ